MTKRATWFIISWLSLLIGVSTVYQAAATSPGPQGRGGSGARAIVAPAVTPRLPAPQAGVNAVAMTETFEGTWPAPGWTVTDQSGTDGGDYRWDKRNCHPHTGSFAGWSVGGGTQGSALGCAGQYPNNANTWAIYGPIDLRGYTYGRLYYYYWGSSNCPNDYLLIGASIDGNDFPLFRQSCGDYSNGIAGNGYYHEYLNLASYLGQSQVWIGFQFFSDGSGTDIGFTIDDISLELGNATPTPSLTWTRTPSRTPTASVTPTTPGVPSHTPTSTVTPTTPGIPSHTPTQTATATPTTPGVPSNTPTATPTTPDIPPGTETPTTTATPMLGPQPPVHLPLIMR